MGLDIYLTGRFRDRGAAGRDLLEEVAAELNDTFEDRLDGLVDIYDSDEGEPVIGVPVHPAAELVEISTPERGRLECMARTNTCGPGYHQFVVEIFEHVGRMLGVKWSEEDCNDDTGYFAARDRGALEQAMLSWLQGTCRGILEAIEEHGAGRMKLCLPISSESFDLSDAVATPLGPRSVSWIRTVASDPSQGRDFFAWWDEQFDARVLLGKAIHLMWTEVRWARPVSEVDFRVLVHVHELLSAAYEEDPDLDYPWAEWNQIIDLLDAVGDDSDLELDEDVVEDVRRKGGGAGPPTIGYRRGDVMLHPVSGWTLRVPGTMTVMEDDDEDPQDGTTLVDEQHMMNVACFELIDELQRSPEAAFKELVREEARPVGRWEAENLVVGAFAYDKEDEDGDPMIEVHVFAIGPQQVLACRFMSSGEGDTDWAMQIARSIEHHPDE